MMIGIFSILIQVQDELSRYLKEAPSLYNPVVISGLIFLLLFTLLYISYRHVYNPMLRKHKKEQAEFEIKTAKMLAVFSELDPNPIIRINTNGIIIGYNKSAKENFPNLTEGECKIVSVIPSFNDDVGAFIQQDETFSISSYSNERYYEINFHGISFLGVAQLYFRDVTTQREYDEQMRNYQALLKNSSLQIQKVLEDERNRVSRVLHDSIAQNLLLVKLNVANYKKFLASGLDQEEYVRTLGILDSTLMEVRDIARNLRPVNIDELGLVTVIRSLCNTVAREAKLKYQLMLPENSVQFDKEIEICVFRILQESLNNIIRYSKAKSFSVNLIMEDHSVLFIVSDDGIGFKARKLLNDKYISDGMGLMNMQESVERLNGSFNIDSAYHLGTKIIAIFPLTIESNDGKPEYKDIGR